MKAAKITEFGPPSVLHMAEMEKPSPKKSEILVKIHARSVNFGDLMARRFKQVRLSEFNMPILLWIPSRLFFGLQKPRVQIMGSEFAGVVETVGEEVKRFKAGEPVFGYRGQYMGAYAEYLCVDENSLVARKPEALSFEEAAVTPYGAITALSLLRKADLKPGTKVLINGASGSIGSAALQLAKNYFGAEVTGVCSTPRVEYVKTLGADHVIDYKKTDFTTNGHKYDLILDVLNKSSFNQCKSSLTERGIYLLASFKTKQLLQMLWTKLLSPKRVICALSSENREDMELLAQLADEGKLKPVLDKPFSLNEAAKAHQYIEEGNKRGSIVLTSTGVTAPRD